LKHQRKIVKYIERYLKNITSRLPWIRHVQHFFYLVLGGILVTVFHHEVVGALEEPLFLWTVVIGSFCMIVIMCAVLLEEMNKVQHAVKTRTKFIALDEDGPGKLYLESEKIITKAKREIFAVNSFTKEELHADMQLCRGYFKALMDKSRQVKYVRILQIDEGKSISELFDPTYIKHFKDMIKQLYTPEREETIEISRVNPRYPSTFLIVDDEWLILQLNEVSHKTSQDSNAPETDVPQRLYHMRGILIVHDPNHFFIEDFRKTFRELHDHSQRLLTMESLG
jgi:hypothetical protein